MGTDRLAAWLAPWLAHAYIRSLRATMRLSFRGREHLDAARASAGRYVLAFWHSRWVLMPYAYPGPSLVVMSSQHRDARLLARVLRRFGLDIVHGSTTRGGAAAAREIAKRVRAGQDFGVTPDGPRGPRRRVQPGVVAIARLGGAPIVPVAYSARPARRLRSWDRTLVPLPFARGVVLYGAPIVVPRDADDAAAEAARLALEQALDRLTDEADALVGIAPEEPR